jgi:hypothetical protein
MLLRTIAACLALGCSGAMAQEPVGNHYDFGFLIKPIDHAPVAASVVCVPMQLNDAAGPVATLGMDGRWKIESWDRLRAAQDTAKTDALWTAIVRSLLLAGEALPQTDKVVSGCETD